MRPVGVETKSEDEHHGLREGSESVMLLDSTLFLTFFYASFEFFGISFGLVTFHSTLLEISDRQKCKKPNSGNRLKNNKKQH